MTTYVHSLGAAIGDILDLAPNLAALESISEAVVPSPINIVLGGSYLQLNKRNIDRRD